ncbi:MAG TPA: alpha/beta hydrolase [Pyrinomonadaceae bacterium]|nr:alpha/beta hydrolase [Pyrinomonadaceae bacterium]
MSIFLLLLCALTFSGPNDGHGRPFVNKRGNTANAQQTEIKLGGYVKNQFGQGVVGAVVTLTGSFSQATVTDASGHYSFTVQAGIYPGCLKEYNVTVSFGGNVIGGRASGGCFSDDINYDDITFTAPYKIRLDGYIKNSAGQGVSGVLLTLTGSDSQSTFTDAGGHFLFNVPAGTPPDCYREYFIKATLGERIIAQISSSGCLTNNFAYDDIIYDPPSPDPTPTPTPPPPPPPPPPQPCSSGVSKILDSTLSAVSPCPTPTPTPTPEPLIFIPGTAGSYLNTEEGANIWLGGGLTDHALLTLDPGKEQLKIVAPDVIRQTTLARQDVRIYQPLLQRLAEAGYIEYRVNGNPARRSAAGCDLSQKSNNPNLFVFAYDWRKNNIENAALLKEYVGCVQKFYPNSKVNVVAHSMGGLVARRYILDNPGAHQVGKLITIGTPWLGAPKAIYILETGRFFESENILASLFLDKFISPKFKALTEFFPSIHQLLPSEEYWRLGGSLFGETKGRHIWDVNNNGQTDEEYTPGQLTDLLDKIQFFRSKPTQTGRAFHDNPGQDDWRNDQTGVQYYHIYGVQHSARTVGKVLATRRKGFDREGEIIDIDDYMPLWVKGDGTVPLISAERTGFGQDLNALGAVKMPFGSISSAPGSGSQSVVEDDLVEHTALTQNPKVLDAILDILKPKPAAIASRPSNRFTPFLHHASLSRKPKRAAGQTELSQTAEAYYLKVYGAGGRIVITDAHGNSNAPSGNAPQASQRVPGVDISQDETSADIILPAEIAPGEYYTLAFPSKDKPIEIEIVKGVGNAPGTASQIIRYMDLNLPAGLALMLKFTSQGVEDLRCDKDGDGTFETVIAPTASVTGKEAQDINAPDVTFTEEARATTRVITINAEDKETGVKVVRYSLDGRKYQPYAAPFSLNACRMRTVYAIADDGAGNRSEVFSYKIANLPPDVSLAQPSIATLWPANHRMVAISIEGVSDPDCDPVTIAITRITQDEATDGTGDSDACPDAHGVGASIAQLRAERSGNGNGRVYTIYFTASDGHGGVTQGNVKVNVPKKSRGTAVDDGVMVDSASCP